MATVAEAVKSARDLLRLDQDAANADRGGAYLAVVNAYRDTFGNQAAESITQLLMQSSISTYSGPWGSAAVIGNLHALLNSGGKYNISLDEFSRRIFTRTLDAIQMELDLHEDGYLTPAELRALDYSVWRELGMGHLFPGDAQRYGDFASGNNPISPESVVYRDGVYFRDWGDPNFKLTIQSVDDDLWNPKSLAVTHFNLSLLMADYSDYFQFRAEDFGISESAVLSLPVGGTWNNGDGTLATHRTYTVLNKDGALTQTHWIEIRQGDRIVANYDPSADIYELAPFLAEGMTKAKDALNRLLWVGDQPPSYDWKMEDLQDKALDALGAALYPGAPRNHSETPRWDQSLAKDFKCFAAGTPILMADGSVRAIESISTGDRVASFTTVNDVVPGVVVATPRSTTDSVFRLEDGILVTAGHPFLCEDGEFRPIQDIIAQGMRVADREGQAVAVRGELLAGEQLRAIGGRQASDGWLLDTFNLTVEGVHTYVAGRYRVHNTSLVEQLPANYTPTFWTTAEDGSQIIIAYDKEGRAVAEFYGVDLDGDGNTDLAGARKIHIDGERIVVEKDNYLDTDGNGFADTLNRTVETGNWSMSFVRRGAESAHTADERDEQWTTESDSIAFMGIDVGTVGGIFGSTLGRLLSDNQLVSTASSVVLGAIGNNLAEAIAVAGLSEEIDFAAAASTMFEDLPTDVRNGAIGAVSSYLTAELFRALELEGSLAEIGQSAAAQYLTQILQNLADIATGVSGVTPFSGLNTATLWNVVGTYVGTKIAQGLVDFDTYEGQIGAQLGAAVGATVATALVWAKLGAEAGSVWGPVGAAVGALVGYVLGGLIGESIGTKPQSWASVVWDGDDSFVVANVSSKGKGPKEAARSMATMVSSTLNSVLGVTGSVLVDGNDVRGGVYGTRAKDYRYWSAPGVKSRSVEDITNHGIYIALSDMVGQMAGGNVYLKRAIANSLRLDGSPANGANLAVSGSFEINGLFGDLKIAEDFSRFVSDGANIKAVIEGDPESAFAAGWAVTLARADELGLRKRSFVDWIGGYGVYLDILADGRMDGVALSPGNLIRVLGVDNERITGVVNADGQLIARIDDTVDASAKDAIAGTDSNDTIVVVGDTLQSGAGLTINGVQAVGAHVIRYTAILDGGNGDDFIRVGDLGNDARGGEGNDTLIGGRLDDWLLGDDGDDVLFAGQVLNTGFAPGDLAGETQAVLADGGNGNFLEGGAGNDRLYGGAGSDWLEGGLGADRLVGGAGADILDGGYGDDRGANGEAALLGGAGTDQYIFGFDGGRDVVFDESSGSAVPGTSGDSVSERLRQIALGQVGRNWAGRGEYEVDGSVRGGEDAIAFASGVSAANVSMRRSGTEATPGNDLIISLVSLDTNGNATLTGDELTIKDWFESTRRVEWLRFADGEEIRIGDMTSYIIGTGGDDVILGTYGADFLYGGAGNDEIRGLAGNDFGNGGAGDDFVAGDGDQDWVLGGSGNDQVLGGAGHDTVFGDDGDDTVYGGTGSDLVVGGRGNDEVVGGAGDDVFRYQRGDGRDVMMDDYVDNWDLVWQNGAYVNGYVLQANGTVTKGGVVYFDGSKWLSHNDWNDEQQILRRHMGAVNGVIAGNAGIDTLEFGVGVDIQDVMLSRSGNDLDMTIGRDNEVGRLDQSSDRVTIKDWYALGGSIENVVFAATGRHSLVGMNLGGGGDANDTILGTAGKDWLTGGGGDDSIDGGVEADILAGNDGADTLTGGAGDDILYGGSGDDTLNGGAGADLLFGGDGIDMASYVGGTGVTAYISNTQVNTGNAKGDVYDSIEGIEGSASADRVGGDGDENVLRGAGGVDDLLGGGGDDTYEYRVGDSNDRIYEGAFSLEEVVAANGQVNAAYTAAWEYLGYGDVGSGDVHQYRLTVTRNDTGEIVYQSNDGVDFLYVDPLDVMPLPSTWPSANGQFQRSTWRNTGNGQQVLREVMQQGDGGVDTVLFGPGISLSNLRMSFGADYLQVDVRAAQIGSVKLVDQWNPDHAVELLQMGDGLVADLRTLRQLGQGGTANGDLLIGSGSADTINSGAGDDMVSGGDGNDTLLAGDGNDILEGGAGADVLDGGTDSVTLGQAPVVGANYGDTIRYLASDAALSVDLTAGTIGGGHATGDTLVMNAGVSTIENVTGTDNFGDTISGDARANRLVGLGGNDWMDGRGGDDVLVGGEGNDTLIGGDGADALAGEAGDDRLEGGLGNDVLAGGAGVDQLLGGAGDDQISADDGDDTVWGGDGNDTIGGQAGADTLYGEAGNDGLVGGDGNDTLDGGAGNDSLSGDAGNDLLRGGAGDDGYLFDDRSGSDRIEDGEGTNRVYLQAVDPSAVWLQRSGNDLVIGVIGGDTTITVAGYYAGGSRVHEIATQSGSLFLAHAEPLVQAMAQASATQPAAMPQAVRDLLDTYWHPGGKAAPRVANVALETNEDVPLVGNVGAVDHDDNITGYTLITGPGMGAVVLDAVTGAWTYTPSANQFGTDRFVVRVTDADGNAAEQVVDLTIHSVNDAPSDLFAPGVLEVDENAANGLSLGWFTREDHDGPGDAPTYELVDDGGGRFAISAGGQLTVLDGVALDFENETQHTIRVRVTDMAGASFEKDFVVGVRNVNEAPFTPSLPPSTTPTIVGEKTSGGDVVATFVLGDEDGTVPTLQLASDPHGLLEVAGNQVRVRAGATVDFEALVAGGATLADLDGDGIKEVLLQASVRTHDGTLASPGTYSFVYAIEDENDAPTAVLFTPVATQIDERDRPQTGAASPAILLGTLGAVDPDTTPGSDFATFAYSVADSRFEIVNGNQLRLKAGAALDFEAAASVSVTVTATDRGGVGLSVSSVLVFTIVNQDDYLYGTAVRDVLSGQANRDIVFGYGGNDTLNGGNGNDDLYGGDGDDQLNGDAGDDRLWGELGNDNLQGGAGVDLLYGGDGTDTLAGGDGNDSLYGDAGNDTLDGGLGDDLLEAGIGNDVLTGGVGNDQLRGGDGDDTLDGGAGADRLAGGAGVDTLTYASATSGIVLDMTGTTANGGGATGDIVEDAFERVIGSAYADTITGTSGNDYMEGGSGNDTLYGGAGNDTLEGGDGNDILDAQSGNDMLIGGAGNDILIGGDDSDVYLIDAYSGSDEIRNYDSNGDDIDVIGYQDINRDVLWFSRSGNNLVISVVGTDVQTTVKDWYLTATGNDRANYKIDFILAGEHVSSTINAEGLVDLMAGYSVPTSIGEFMMLYLDEAFANRWAHYWDGNGLPTISNVANQTVNEDGAVTVQFTVADDLTQSSGVIVTAKAVDPNDLTTPIGWISPMTVQETINGRTVVVSPNGNRSGRVAIKLTATDAGGLTSERIFFVDVLPQADMPLITRVVQVGTTLDSGTLALDVQAALVDTDGSETLEVRISNVPTGLTLNRGTNLGGGVWSLTPAQLTGLALVGASTWSQDLTGAAALTVTAISTEAATGQSRSTTATLPVTINARPTDITVDRTLALNESTAATPVANGTVVGNFARVDADNDSFAFTLTDNAGGRFAISTAGVLTVANGSLLDFEAASSHQITVRVTDSGGLTRDETFTVTINNVDEAPGTPSITSQPVTIAAENAALGDMVVASLSSSGGNGTYTYAIENDPRGWFSIVGNQLRFKTGLSLNYEVLKAAGMTLSDMDGDGRQEVVYSIDVRAVSGGLQSPATRTITMRLEDVNDTPHDIFNNGAVTIPENSPNGTVVTSFGGSDEDSNDGLTFSLANNAGGRFTITAAGVLSVANVALLDYEAANAHTITVRVTDGQGAYRDENFTVAVTNVNEVPTTPSVSQSVYVTSEHVGVGGQVVATLYSSDPDGTTPSYQIVNDPWSWFAISGNQLVYNVGSFDFESAAPNLTVWDGDGDGQAEAYYNVTVRATDGALASGNSVITVRIEDVNEAPSTWGQNFSFSEASPGAGQTRSIEPYAAWNDPDTQASNRGHTYAITGGASNLFSIDQWGYLVLHGQLNYEAAQSHSLLVTVTDARGASSSSWVTVYVTNANEAPTFAQATYQTSVNIVGMGTYGSGTAPMAKATDPDGDALTYTILSKTGGGGTVTLTASNDFSLWVPPYDIEPRTVVVQAKDPSGLTTTATYTIRVYRSGGPILFDLDGDGVELVSLAQSSTTFDMDGDGKRDQAGWMGPHDGLLALDRNGNGIIDNGSEISFSADLPGAFSDLEGLAAYDTDGNRRFDSADQRFGEFKVWRDGNRDGVTDAGELMSLREAGIASIDLDAERTGADPYSAPDNVIYANGGFTRADGTRGSLADVFLGYGKAKDAEAGSSTPDNAVIAASELDLAYAPAERRGLRTRDSVAMPVQSRTTDAGTGDAAAGKVDRRASRTEAIVSVDGQPDRTMPQDAPTHSRSNQDPVSADIPVPEANSAQLAGPATEQGDFAPIDDAFEPSTVLERSALHDNLALAQKKRFQMIEAMSVFSAQPYGDGLSIAARDPATIELLTALPDYRIARS